MFRDPFIDRIVEPLSKADFCRVLDGLGEGDLRTRQSNDTIAQVIANDYRDVIATRCVAQASASGTCL